MEFNQHRHDQPGHPNEGASEKWWHDVNHVHSKYPTAHDHILGTRLFTPKAKVKAPEFSFNEYGEAVIPPPPPSEGELFALEAALAEAEVKAALGKVKATK